MFKFAAFWFSAICVVFCARSSDAGVITQTFNFTDSNASGSTGSLVIVDANGVSFSVNPFNSSLGTLDSFTLAWNLNITGDGNGNGPASSLHVSYGGSTYVNTSVYNGWGDSLNATGAGLYPTQSNSFTLTNTFTPANSGITYNPAILAAITGGSQFNATFKGGPNTARMSYQDVSFASGEFTAGLTVTYNYTSAVPEPSFAVAGLALATATVFVRRRRAARHAA